MSSAKDEVRSKVLFYSLSLPFLLSLIRLIVELRLNLRHFSDLSHLRKIFH